jgi:hypothetical protein
MSKLSHESEDMVKAETHTVVSERLLSDVRLLIESAKSHLAQTANAVLVALYWNIGKRIKTEILGNERAQYGKETVSTLSRQLTAEYLTELPPRRLLESKLHEAIRIAREQIAVCEVSRLEGAE